MKKLLSIVILIFVLTSLLSCNNEIPPDVANEGTDAPITEPPEISPPETEPLVVYEYTPSLAGKDEIEKIGVQIGDVIVELIHTGMNGEIILEGGRSMFVDGGIPLELEKIPLLKHSEESEMIFYNNLGYGNISEPRYYRFDPEDSDEFPKTYIGSEDVVSYPEEQGKYLVNVHWSFAFSNPMDPSPEEIEAFVGRLIGYIDFYFILIVE